MYYALLADIHANYVALNAVAADAQTLAAADGAPLQFICLGDVVDYGPQPVECVAWVAANAAHAVVGNHDQAALSDDPPLGVDERLWPITIWTRHALDGAARAVIKSWSETTTLGPFQLFHSSLALRDAYITGPGAAEACMRRLRAAAPYGCFGHTHIASLFLQGPTELALLLPCPPGIKLMGSVATIALDVWHSLPSGGLRALVNPGSVGQPRRHALLAGAGVAPDTAAAYALLRESPGGEWQVRFRRAPYDVEATVALLEGLRWSGAPAPLLVPHPLARRLQDAYAQMSQSFPATIAQLAAQLRS